MAWFTKNKIIYTLPERLSPEEARERRLTALLEKERRFLDVPNFSEVQGRLAGRARVAPGVATERYREALKNSQSVAQRIVNEPQVRVQKAASIAAALKKFRESDFADEASRKMYRRLRQAQQDQQNVRPSGSDKRRYDPTGRDWSATTYGTAARVAGVGHRLLTGWTPMFLNPAQVFPCIQRKVQREVMFATKKAGRGYHTRKRRTWSSGVPC